MLLLSVLLSALRRRRYAATVVRLAQVFEQNRRLRLRDRSTKNLSQPAAWHCPIVTSGTPQATCASPAAQHRPSHGSPVSPLSA